MRVAAGDDGAGRLELVALGIKPLRIAGGAAQGDDRVQAAVGALQRRGDLTRRVDVRAVAEHDVEQHDGHLRVARRGGQPLGAQRRVDHRVRAPLRVLVGPEVDELARPHDRLGLGAQGPAAVEADDPSAGGRPPQRSVECG